MSDLYDSLFAELLTIPAHDVHTHIDASHPVARGLHDVLLYHMVISELYSAGCPDGARLSEGADEDEALYRLERAVPYVKYIKNTSCFWGVRIILRDLFGWTDGITEDNWRELHSLIKSKNAGLARAREIMRAANIVGTGTELWRGRGHLADDIFNYAIEWAFFTRNQWGQFDTALLELEYAWNQETPGAPLPVTTDRSLLNLKKTIKTLDDVKAAIKYYCDKMPYGEVASNASHFSTDINYRSVTEREMADALTRRETAGPAERDVYANYIHEEYLKELDRRGSDLILSYSIGAEPLPFETGSKLRPETVYEFAALAARYPRREFQIYLSNAAQNQPFCTVARELPNVRLVGYWWHNFFPSEIRAVMSERLDMLPTNRQLGFFSDAYCFDWSYAKSVIVRRQLAEVLAQKIAQGQYTRELALEVARSIL